MRPDPIAFSVPLRLVNSSTGEALGPRWLGPTGTPVESEANAVVFQMHRSPTPREGLRIERREHELAGGLRDYLEVQNGAQAAPFALIRLLERELWPAGRPERVDKADEIRDDAALDVAWRASDSLEKQYFAEANGVLERLGFIARWAVLIVSPPAGWEDIADREMPEPQLYAIIAAHAAAMAPVQLGKQPPSAS